MENKKAVTLIVLVITIIVMAILAATVITSLNDTNILDRAKEVAFKTDMLAYKDSYDMYVITSTLDNIFFDETELNLSYGDDEYTKILGEVPKKYQEGLKVIKGKLVYITTDEKESQIIDKIDMLPNKIKIVNNLTKCTTNNTITEIEYEKSYEATITANTGYTLKQVTVVMGNKDITSTVYNSTTNKISISSVTDKVIITATTNANVYTITNSLTNVTTSNANSEATIGTNYEATLAAKTGYTLKTVKVTMNGLDVTNTVYNSQTRTITISSITGNVIITANANINVYTVTNILTGVANSNTQSTITYGSKYTAILTANTGYTLKTVKVIMGGADITNIVYNETTNTITIASVTGDIEITSTSEKGLTKATIPSGFYYVGGEESTGLVISDNAADKNKGVDYTCVGNQFVWIPVEDYSKFVRGTAVETSSGSGIYKMTGTLSSSYTEPYASGYSDGNGTEEKAEYNKMMLSVKKNKGFYIARFEAGDGDATAARTTVTTAHKVVSKKNAYVYNYVPWGKSMRETSATTIDGVVNVAGVVELSKNMYKESTSVVSTLCYGVQWDAVMNFVSDATHNIKDSRYWGNYSDSEGAAATNSGSSNMNYTTGRNEAWKAKSIYDLAGNVREWTMESDSSNYRFFRGGGYVTSGSYTPASFRYRINPTAANYDLGFRVTLYIQ